MADKKISALTAAATPLAGTEVLPIVQSGATVKVASDDLTVRNIRANATTGILQVTGPGAGTTRVATVPNANWTAARTDAAQSFTGDQTLATGNLIIGTSGKGIDFSATPGTGTSELFSDYEEGTWTPSVGGVATYLNQDGYYVKIGRQVTAYFKLRINVLGTGTDNRFTGLPFTASTDSLRGLGNTNYFSSIVTSTTWLVPFVDSTTVYFAGNAAIDAASDDVLTVFQNGAYIIGSVTYLV